jgi:hypothetical protein
MYHSGKMSKVCSKWFHPEYCYSISITLLMTMESRAMKSELLCRHAITKWVAIKLGGYILHNKIRLIVTARLDPGYPRRNSTAACVHHGAISIVSSRRPHPQWVLNTYVVEVHVDSKEAKRAKELLSECWHKETFVKELEENSVGMLIDFIPNIQKGVMEVSTFRETLRRQTEVAGNMIAISIEGIGGLEVKINHNGSLALLADIVKKLKSDEGKPLISGIEPTKFTSDSGRYLFF